MNLKNIFWSLFLLLIIPLSISSQIDFSNLKVQRIASENIKIEKGLSQNSIFCIHQDSKGYMWFGTWDGLNKYDGYKFSVFKSSFMDTLTELTNQTVHSLFEDRNGVMWIGTSRGLNSFDLKTRKFNYYKKNINDPYSLSGDTIWSIQQDKEGYLWLGTNNGLNRLDIKTGEFLHFNHDPENNESILDDFVFEIFVDDQGDFWICTDNGLNRFDPKKQLFSKYCNTPNQVNSLCGRSINSICQDDNGFFWVGTNSGLFKLEKAKGVIGMYTVENGLTSNHVNAVEYDPNGYLWIGTEGGGVNILDIKEGQFVNLRYEPGGDNSISGDVISSLYLDRTGIMWVGTNWKGVNKVDVNAFRFNVYRKTNNRKGLNSSVVWTMCEVDENNIWIGTGRGINVFNRETETFSYITHIPGNENSLSHNEIRSIIKDNNNNIWIGTFGGGLNLYIPEENKYIHFNTNSPEHQLKNDVVWSLYVCRNGDVWAGTEGGVHKIDPESHEITIYDHDPNNPNSISHNSIFDFYEDEDGILWMGTYRGINKLNPNTGSIERLNRVEGNDMTFSIEGVFSIFKDENNVMWFATIGGGLLKYDVESDIYTSYSEKDGLPNNVVYCTLDDGEGNLWMSTNLGVSKFNVKDETFLNYDAQDGIQSNEFNLGANLITHDGMMLFGGMGGFNMFNPHMVRTNINVPPIVITSVKIFNEELPYEISDGDVIELNYDENFISFEFSALDFTNPSKNHYAYKLSSVDDDWKHCDASRRFAEYKQLAPGEYTLTIIGSNNENIWNQEGITVTIIINPPWWETWAFRILFFGGLFVIVFLVLYSRYLGIKKKHAVEKKVLEIEKQLFEHERKALRLQMNPHFIFNTLNSIQYFILQNDKLSSNRYLTMFSRLMRITLDNSQHNTIILKDELSALQLYVELESLRFEERFDFHFDIDYGLELSDIKIPTMIIQPYVENAIKHGLMNKPTKGMLIIKIYREEERVICVVEDNGVGRDRAREIKENTQQTHVSLGTHITESRLKLINSLYGSDLQIEYDDLKDEKGQALGTRVSIYIPIMNKN